MVGGGPEPSADFDETRRPTCHGEADRRSGKAARKLADGSEMWSSPEWKGGRGLDFDHSLAAVSRDARLVAAQPAGEAGRASATRMGLHPED